MARALKRGTKIRISTAGLRGEVIKAEANGDDFGYRVKYEHDGESHERFFSAEEIEPVQPLTPAEYTAKGTPEACAERVAISNPWLSDRIKELLEVLPGDSFKVKVCILGDAAVIKIESKKEAA